MASSWAARAALISAGGEGAGQCGSGIRAPPAQPGGLHLFVIYSFIQPAYLSARGSLFNRKGRALAFPAAPNSPASGAPRAARPRKTTAPPGIRAAQAASGPHSNQGALGGSPARRAQLGRVAAEGGWPPEGPGRSGAASAGAGPQPSTHTHTRPPSRVSGSLAKRTPPRYAAQHVHTKVNPETEPPAAPVVGPARGERKHSEVEGSRTHPDHPGGAAAPARVPRGKSPRCKP